MKCQNCGAELAEGVSFCRECGTKVEKRKSFCRECGVKLTDGVNFCSECGANIEIITEITHGASQSSENKTDSTITNIGMPVTMKNTDNTVQITEAEKTEKKNIQGLLETVKSSKYNTRLIALAAIVTLIFVAVLSGKIRESKTTSSDTSVTTNTVFNEITSVVSSTATIEPGTEYAYMSDAWNVYIAKAVSSNVIKVESWHKTNQSDKEMKFRSDLGSFKITDEENGFSWIDDEHTAFNLIIQDKNNSEIEKSTLVLFTINISDTDVDKGTDYDNNIACYEYVNDDWHTYRAIALTDNLIKIECWYRTSSGFFGSHRFGWDVGIIDINNTATDFEWGDDNHKAFTITMNDPANSIYWKDEKLTSFILENEDYKYNTVLSYLGKSSDITETVDNSRPQKDGFDSQTNEQYTIGSYTIEVPKYWKSENTISDGVQRYAETDNKVAMLQLTCSLETDSNYEVSFDGLMDDNDNIIKAIEATAFKKVTEYEVIDTGVVKGILYKGTIEVNGINGSGLWFAFPSESDRSWCVIMSCQTDNTDYSYDDDFMKIIYSIKLSDANQIESETTTVPDIETTEAPVPETTKASKAVSYSTNTKDTVKNGDSGVYAYKNRGGTYDVYYIIDFDNCYVYYFCDGNGDEICHRLKIDSGTLNDVVLITYHDGGTTWQEGLHFKWFNQPEHLIWEDHDHFEYDFYSTDLNKALLKRKSKTIKDY